MPEIPNPQDTVTYMDLEPALAGLVHDLPWMGSNWTRAEREAWIKAFNAVCDMLWPDDDPARYEVDASDAKFHVANEAAKEHMRREVVERTEERASKTETTIERVTERKFINQEPYRGAKDAARIVHGIIQQVGNPAHVWLTVEGKVRVCAADYVGADGESLIGVYDKSAKQSAIAADLKAVKLNGESD